MPLALFDDLTAFLADFGVPVTSGAVSGLGILDMPTEVIEGGMVLTTEYLLTARAADFGGLLYGDGITVDGINYQVRETRMIDDGLMVHIALQKLAPDAVAAGRSPREFGLADLADVSIRNPEAGDLLVYNGSEWVDMEESDGTNVIDGKGAG